MYFLTALVCAVIFSILWYFNRDKKQLHLEIPAIAFGSATLMWFVDCVFSLAQGESFFSFDDPKGVVISIWTVVAGMLIWGVGVLLLKKK